MANALYYFTPVGVAGAWQPYAGGGLGVADLNVDDFPNELGGDFDSDYKFAYQLIGGVAYNITPNWQPERRGPLLRDQRPGCRERRGVVQVDLPDLRPALRRDLRF